MTDKTGRTIDYMRISVTAACNLNCIYCKPSICSDRIKNELTGDEICSIVKSAASLGIRKIKITGGEPLLRKDLCDIISGIKQISGIEQVTITTNGTGLKSCYRDLVNAGIDGINISLDTIDRDEYRKITGSELDRVMDGLNEIMAQSPDFPVKINTVALGLNSCMGVLKLAKDNPIAVRFIELMPLGAAVKYKGVTGDEIKNKIIQMYGYLTPIYETIGNGPAKYYSIPDFKGKAGFISPVHHIFCRECNRIRLTSDGYLKACLCYDLGVNLASILRNAVTSQKNQLLTKAMEQVIYNKPLMHCFDTPENITEQHFMSRIGG